MYNLTKDISTLTGISVLTLEKIISKVISSICYDVQESTLNKNEISEIDIGIGNLMIKNLGGEVAYKFIPNSKLNNSVIETLKTGKSPLENSIEIALRDKVAKIRKELF
jgi:hypothetical protein